MPDLVFEIRLLSEVLKDAFGHGRATDVAQTDKEDGYLVRHFIVIVLCCIILDDTME